MARSSSKSMGGGKAGAGTHPESTLRLIGGTWRSRKLTFREIPGLRPTPDRVRETLFNWLAPVIAGARCLDLFAGSGALGLEALSRGAGETWFVEADVPTANTLRRNLQVLDASNGKVIAGDAMGFLTQPPAQPFDIVFLDPPFRQGWLDRVCPILQGEGWIAPGGRIYLEYERENPPTLAGGWHSLRKKEAGQLCFQLLEKTGQ